VTFGQQGQATMCDVLPPGESAFQPQTGNNTSITNQLAMYGDFRCKERPLDESQARSGQTSERTINF
jgi:hypothetical protein